MSITPGLGTTISRAGTPAIQVVGITPPNLENPSIDTTTLSSTWRTSQGTVPDGGEITFTVQFDASSTTHSTLVSSLLTAATTTAAEAYVITHADTGAATWSFNGHIVNVSLAEVLPDNIAMCTVTVKVTGAVTLTP